MGCETITQGAQEQQEAGTERTKSLASVGQTVVWVIEKTIIRDYNLTTKQEHTVLDIGSGFLRELALDGGLLYYEGGSQERPGLYTRRFDCTI
jgi:hypothetical protein